MLVGDGGEIQDTARRAALLERAEVANLSASFEQSSLPGFDA
jgi:hypothetical protein